MKSIKFILYIIISIITALFIFSFFLSQEYSVKRTIEILSPADSVFSYINNLKNWEKWTVWNLEKNSNIIINYEKKTEGVGAKIYWTEKDEKAGDIQISYSVPYDYVKYDMHLGNYDLKISGSFIQKSNINRTTINWIKVCNVGFNPLAKYFAYLFFEEQIGNDMSKSLRKLKQNIESNFQ
ncbi:MAG TPA: hypothetical protein PKY56_05325 [Candidatus Kapabacteria bacterium]|nr:hypothetical protein [Candidatus Kapabacteria bacterium]HPO62968.1 hypothetical protein [Candidatus Kapabacteria bacterium]